MPQPPTPVKNRSLLVWAVAFAVQAAVFALLSWRNPGAFLEQDSFGYFACAESFQKTADFDSTACFTRTPAYPLLLVLTGSSAAHPQPAIWLNMLLASFTVLIFYRLARRACAEPRAFLWSVLLSCDAVFLTFSHQVMTETTFLFLLTASLALVAGGPAAAGAGGLLQGAMTLVRPIAVFWPLVQGAWLAAAKKRAGVWVLAAYLVASMGVIQARSWHNWNTHGFWTVSRVSLDNVHTKTMHVMTELKGVKLEDAHRMFQTRYDELGGAADDTEAERERLYERVFFDTVRRYPLATLVESLHSVRKILTEAKAPEFAQKGEKLRVLHQAVQHANFAWNAFVWVLIGWFLWRAVRGKIGLTPREKAGVSLCLLLIGYYVVLSTPGGAARFRYPILPAMYFLAMLAHAHSARRVN